MPRPSCASSPWWRRILPARRGLRRRWLGACNPSAAWRFDSRFRRARPRPTGIVLCPRSPDRFRSPAAWTDTGACEHTAVGPNPARPTVPSAWGMGTLSVEPHRGRPPRRATTRPTARSGRRFSGRGGAVPRMASSTGLDRRPVCWCFASTTRQRGRADLVHEPFAAVPMLESPHRWLGSIHRRRTQRISQSWS
jgi:hypothetical protein